MNLDQRAAELGQHVQQILKEFQNVHCSAANGPHVALNQQELRVIEFLGREGNQIMRAVADHLSLAVNSVTSLVDGLEQKELVVRTRSTVDRRAVVLELTDVGHSVWQAAEASKLQLYKAILNPLSSDEQDQFLCLFRKIAHVADQPLAVQQD